MLKKIILGIIGLFIVLIIIGVANSIWSKKVGTTEQQSNQQQSFQQTMVIPFNKTFNGNNYTYKLEKVEEIPLIPSTTTGDQPILPKGKFIQATLSAQNIGKEPGKYDPIYFMLIDTEDRRFSPDESATFDSVMNILEQEGEKKNSGEKNSYEEWGVGNLQPEEKGKTLIIFDIGESITPKYLLYIGPTKDKAIYIELE